MTTFHSRYLEHELFEGVVSNPMSVPLSEAFTGVFDEVPAGVFDGVPAGVMNIASEMYDRTGVRCSVRDAVLSCAKSTFCGIPYAARMTFFLLSRMRHTCVRVYWPARMDAITLGMTAKDSARNAQA